MMTLRLMRTAMSAALVGLRLAASTPAHLLVICLMLGQNLLSQLLFSLMDIRIKLVAILADGELLVIINRNINFLCTIWLLVRVVELGDVRVFESLFSSQPFGRVKM